MSNITITPVDIGNVILCGAVFGDRAITAGVPGTLPEGTLLQTDDNVNYVPYVVGEGPAVSVTTHDIEFATDTTQVPSRVMIGGKVRLQRLTALAGPLTAAQLAVAAGQLQDNSILAVETEELADFDNQ